MANRFRALHEAPNFLVLPNAWDAVSARVLESLGAPAVATSSAAVAWAHGYPDGHALPVPLLLETLRDMTRVLRVPVTADIEGGYSSEPRTVGDTVMAVIDAGAVGINLEDRDLPPDLLCAKIEAARNAAARRAVPLFVNARTDVFLRNLASGDAAVTETAARAKRYASVGADGIFVPGIVAPDVIATIARDVPKPLNVMARPGLPPATELRRLGARRLSAATWLHRVALSALRSAAEDYLANGDSDRLAQSAGTVVDYNTLMIEGAARSTAV
jgi:2-methylisocitrate lyase-like PEP mutase family enzyme